VAVVGFIDDYSSLKVRMRLLLQFSMVLVALFLLGDFGSYGFSLFVLGALYLFAATSLVWLLNLYNFMDGIDGLAGGEACFVCVSAFLILVFEGRQDLALPLGILLMASLGFLIWNWPPAKIFMGDGGSGFLGYTLGVLALITIQDGVMNIYTWLLLLAVFVVDATVTLLWRIGAGEIWHQAHCSHAYQHAARLYQSHARVSVSVVLINILWLLPLAVLTVHYPANAIYIALVGLFPLVLMAISFGAGRSELVENC